jgi:2-iminobutanoate/2-iminopropanoate deaminase
MPKTIVRSDSAPPPVASYSQAVRAEKLLFVSGQIPIDPATGALVEGGIEAQTERALENLKSVLVAGRASFSDVVKVTVYLIDMADFPAFNGVYAKYFSQEPPARVTVAVVGLPRGARIELDAIAACP